MSCKGHNVIYKHKHSVSVTIVKQFTLLARYFEQVCKLMTVSQTQIRSSFQTKHFLCYCLIRTFALRPRIFWHVMSWEWLTWCILLKLLFGELCDYTERGWVRGYGPSEFGHPPGQRWPFPGSAEELALLLCLDTASSFIRTLDSYKEWAHRVCSCLPHHRLVLVFHQDLMFDGLI